MGYYSDWVELAKSQDTKEKHEAFWKEYYDTEKAAYEAILESLNEPLSGTYAALSDQLHMTRTVFAGFLDGINTSLKKEYDIDSLKSNSRVTLDVDLEKLYFNMLDAKADWLYTLPQWDGILSAERRAEIEREWKQSKTAVSTKVGRNMPCPCGSGKKYKKCCGAGA
jgi:hypothetical protein